MKITNKNASGIICRTVIREKWLSVGIIFTVISAVGSSLIPPLVLGKIIDQIASGNIVGFSMIAFYFFFIVMTVFWNLFEKDFSRYLVRKSHTLSAVNFLRRSITLKQIR